jgi:hypothetical protein
MRLSMGFSVWLLRTIKGDFISALGLSEAMH